MKLISLIVLLLASSSLSGAQSPATDIPGNVLSSIGAVSRQLSGIQGVLSQLSSQIQSFVSSASRLVGGLQAENGSGSSAAANFSGVMSAFQSISSRFASLQRSLSDMTASLRSLIASGSRIFGRGDGSSALNRSKFYFADEAQEATFIQTLFGSLSDLTRQMNSVSSVLRNLNVQFINLVQSSSRIATGLAAEESPLTAVPAPVQSTSVPGSEQFNGTSAAAGQPSIPSAGSAPSLPSSTNSSQPSNVQQPAGSSGPGAPTDSVLRAITSASEQFATAQKVLTDVSGHISRIFATSSKLVTGNQGPSPADTVLDTLQRTTNQFQEIQKVVRSVSNQFNRMIETGSKMLNGDNGKRELFYEEADPSPMHILVNSWMRLTTQLRSIQGVLEQINGQVNQMVSSGSRILTGPSSKSALRRARQASTEDVISSLQRATAELTRQLGEVGSTIAKMAQGATGFRMAGQRSREDDYSSLNPVAVFGRQVGNIAGALTRAVGG